MRAEILAIGSELLTPLRVDTNALFLTGRLLELGIAVGARITVADDPELLESAFRAALARSQVVIATGGLGPTEDDLTREAAARALGRALSRRPELVAALEARFASFGRVMAPVNLKQADLIDGAVVIENPRGTAPGQYLEAGDRLLVLLPGPPREMQPLFDERVRPLLAARSGGRVLRTRVLRIAGMGESDVEQRVAPVYTSVANPVTTILGGAGQVELHLTAEGGSEAEAEERIEALAARLREALPGRVYSEDGRELPEVVGQLLRERSLTLAVAESCTGGLLAKRLTDVAGSSVWFERGWVTYSNAAKIQELGVAAGLIDERGAVSEEVARAMAEGARSRSGAAIGVGITGIAGPEGGSPEKPVGLVYVALDGAAGGRVRELRLPGDRLRIRRMTTQVALELVRRGLLGLGA